MDNANRFKNEGTLLMFFASQDLQHAIIIAENSAIESKTLTMTISMNILESNCTTFFKLLLDCTLHLRNIC